MRVIDFKLCKWPVFILLLSILAAWPKVTQAQKANINRPLDYVVIQGQTIPGLIDTLNNQICAYRFSLENRQWTKIPFQIDDWDGINETFAGLQNDSLDNPDQMVFLAGDLGDQADTLNWINDEESKANFRYQVQVVDPLTNNTGWVYFFNSPTLNNTVPSRVFYNSLRDSVATNNYMIIHKDRNYKSWANGFPMDLKILPAIGGNGVDIMDRYKLRLYAKATYDLGVGKVDIEAILYEDSTKVVTIDAGILGKVYIKMEKKQVRYSQVGPVRLIRELILMITTKGTLAGTAIDDSTEFPFTTQFFPSHWEFSSGQDLKIPTDFGDPNLKVNVQYFRISADLNAAAMGMFYYDEYNNETNVQGLKIIDGRKETSFDATSLTWPGVNWYTVAGTQGSIFTIFKAVSPLVSAGRALPFFYDDSNSPGWPSSYPPGVQPTGDRQSWGDTGFTLQAQNTGTGMTGPIDFSVRHYYLGPDLTLQQSRAYVNQFKNPVTFTIKEQQADTPPPFVALAVDSVGTNNVTLTWIAPTENKKRGGACSSYEIRYSTNPPDDDIELWWVEASPSKIWNPIPPAAPGTVEKYKVSGLSQNTTYWFGIAAMDKGGKWSGVNPSSIATSSTTPVELVAFTGESFKNTINLEWSTASETNNYGFEIQRKANKSETWEKVGFVSGKGTTNVPQSYQFSEKITQLGNYNYRLKQIDSDGSFELSKELTIVVAGPKEFALSQNYPNPFNPNTTIQFEVPMVASGNATVSLQVFDLLGRLVRTLVNNTVSAGYHEIQWDGRDDNAQPVASGVYFYVLSANQFRNVKKMIKIQ